ncbi:MAG: uroporphyrinogen decarboxylase [Alphaproteobacteria bacterium]|nr:uroporphyrinogen decarboxylase [Alphaproteobacteria bacterium]
MKKDKKNILSVLKHESADHTPIWLMRQAGRYLPEYRALRERAGSFMNLCFNPELASEVTLQPVRRFKVDGAILFSDILVVPYGLGYKLDFIENEGPKLETVSNSLAAFEAESFFKRTAPIYETVRKTKAALESNVNGADVETQHVTMLGFAGSPYTVACYMMGGKGKDEFIEARLKAQQNPVFFQSIIDLLVTATSFYLIEQIKAGAEVLQLFDSWSGLVPATLFDDWVINPTKQIVTNIKKEFPHIPIIGFPRMAGAKIIRYAEVTGVDALSLDQSMDLAWAQKNLPEKIVLQGNLDPLLMQADKATLLKHAQAVMQDMKRPFIFNLGHGLTPQVPPENVGALVEFVQGYKK